MRRWVLQSYEVSTQTGIKIWGQDQDLGSSLVLCISVSNDLNFEHEMECLATI